jgi:hypothetical protein
MAQRQQAARFEIAGVDGEDPLDLWTAAPEHPVHFGMVDDVAAVPADTPVYRVQLPADIASAEAALREREARLQRSAWALETVPDRLDDLVTRTQARQRLAESQEVHFGIHELGTGQDTAETELLDLLAEADGAGAALPPGRGQVDFGLGDELLDPAIEQARAQLNALFDHVNREVLHFAWVETAIQDQILARTSVGWSGDAETVWKEGILQEQAGLHHRALGFATHSRALKMRMALTVTGGALKVAALMTNPAGPMLALPVVYRYVKQMLAQASELRQINPIQAA